MDHRSDIQSNAWIGDPRHDAEGRTEDPDVAETFDDSTRPRRLEYSDEQGTDVQKQLEQSAPHRDLSVGDPDADLNDANYVGQEFIAHPTPDQSDVELRGRAAGLSYQDGEPLGGTDKIEKRDRERWELDPASSEDFHERRQSQE